VRLFCELHNFPIYLNYDINSNFTSTEARESITLALDTIKEITRFTISVKNIISELLKAEHRKNETIAFEIAHIVFFDCFTFENERSKVKEIKHCPIRGLSTNLRKIHVTRTRNLHPTHRRSLARSVESNVCSQATFEQLLRTPFQQVGNKVDYQTN
jgi:hypothetical protein